MKLLFASVLCLACLIPVSTQAGNSAPWVGIDFNGLPCNGERQGYGPWDYTNADERGKIPIVEQYHFDKDVELLIRPMQGNFAGDFDYTLRAVPNHHRALLSLIRYQLQLNAKLRNTHKPKSPVECYLLRAINFSPDDMTAVSLYAYYLHKMNKNEEALKAYEFALAKEPDSISLLYRFGLFLVDIKKYEKALEIATKVYKNGKAPNGLKNKLIKLGLWKNP